ncbi:MAG TPA: cation diffusion facilitator family transporter [Flavisolibacter sp.]|nr:cation diffusion facilitator family transporter [Flavisolibacter sp.]
MSVAQQNYSIQKKLTSVTLVIFVIKIVAWALTHSIAILTDTLEYTINVVAGFISLYSLYLSSLPKDRNHPYGHGKAEFLSAAIEAILMILSSFFILYEAINNFVHPHTLLKLDQGILLIALTALLNFIVGFFAEKKGKKNKSLALVATGRHMKSDTYATIGIISGLIVLYFTGYQWIDSIVSIFFAFIILFTSYKILRSSVAGIMDEADTDLLNNLVKYLSDNRRENWMDLHNLRIIKYGAVLHVDCHLTVPYYFTIEEGHSEVKMLEDMVRASFGESVEMFVHMDGCLYSQCPICFKTDCPVRKHPFNKRIEWTIENVSANHKHTHLQPA